MTVGWLIHVQGKVKKKFYNDDLEFKISSMSLLSEILDKEVRELVLKVNLNDITEDFTREITEIITQNPGKHSLIIKVVDVLNKYEVDLLSRKVKINLDSEFVDKINKMKQLKMKIK
jgi:DNA polymerase-3 subunit alpha